mmetsp:Transcript_30869/g.50238  ORF Transcript_30869/g.50238 Transcript_30869/m.50238 type:complete len:424 (-) Transcript_30869:107-1378(-)
MPAGRGAGASAQKALGLRRQSNLYICFGILCIIFSGLAISRRPSSSNSSRAEGGGQCSSSRSKARDTLSLQRPGGDGTSANAIVQASMEIEELREELADCRGGEANALNSQPADDGKSVIASPPAPATSSSSAWLTIMIPSVSRGSTDYLSPTISAILSQIPDTPGNPVHESVRILVVDNTPLEKGAHKAFEALRERHRDNPIISFHVQPKRGRHDEGTDPDHANKPGARVRTQTKDLIYTIRQTPESSKHLFIMEDDFFMCSGTLDAILYMISKAYRIDPEWLAMKVSYGFNGILLRDRDVRPFAAYLEKRYRDRPPDHIQTEWWQGEKPESRAYKGKRSYFVFRYNLLEHIGVKSSLRSKEMVGFGVCGQEMNTELMFPVDAFDSGKCGNNDMSPCGRDDKPENRWVFMANPKRRPQYQSA